MIRRTALRGLVGALVMVAAVFASTSPAQAGNVYKPEGCIGWAHNGGDPSGSQWAGNCYIGAGYEVSSNGVLAVQRMAAYWGCNPGTPDGLWGTNTKNAVICFQNKRGLPADGMVGKFTWGALAQPWRNCVLSGGYYYCHNNRIAEKYVADSYGVGAWSWVLNKAGTAFNHLDNNPPA